MSWHRAVPAIAVVVFFGVLVAVIVYFGQTLIAVRLTPIPQFGIFVMLVGVLAGFAGASVPYTLVWLGSLSRSTMTLGRRRWLGLSLAVLCVGILVFGTLVFAGSLGPRHLAPVAAVDAELTKATRPVTFCIAALESPGLIGLLGVRHVAAANASWGVSPRTRMLLLIRLRTELRRLLALLGAALTLLVVATGVRRRALLAYDPSMPIPKEQVLLYGLVFAALLALVFLSASGAIDKRAATIVDALEPFPDPSDPDFPTRVARRTQLSSAMGSPSTLASFESTVVIAGPLLSALIGLSTAS